MRIPMRGVIGSLNAAVAGSVLLFEAVAQRDQASPTPSPEPAVAAEPAAAEPDEAEPAAAPRTRASRARKPAAVEPATHVAAADEELLPGGPSDEPAAKPRKPRAPRTPHA
jgi:hypothetical protein